MTCQTWVANKDGATCKRVHPLSARADIAAFMAEQDALKGSGKAVMDPWKRHDLVRAVDVARKYSNLSSPLVFPCCALLVTPHNLARGCSNGHHRVVGSGGNVPFDLRSVTTALGPLWLGDKKCIRFPSLPPAVPFDPCDPYGMPFERLKQQSSE